METTYQIPSYRIPALKKALQTLINRSRKLDSSPITLTEGTPHQIKVKKDVIGGTVHYNFEKFECEVCKAELPMTIDVNGTHYEMLPITKPKANYLILEAAC